MTRNNRYLRLNSILLFAIIFILFGVTAVLPKDKVPASIGNFGLPGMIDLPTAWRLPDGELVITQQLHKSLARTGISFQVLPRVGLVFRYSGHGTEGGEAYGRINHDRSIDAHISILDESKFVPALSLGLRDFIGTGWYSSEYIVGSKEIGNLEITAGVGFGRIAGSDSFSNPFKGFLSNFETRTDNKNTIGGNLGSINWYRGNASLFYGLSYRIGDKISITAEYNPDLMVTERAYYLDMDSQWNFGLNYQINKYAKIAAQYLHGNQFSLSSQISINPKRAPLNGGKELAPVPMRLRDKASFPVSQNREDIIRKVLHADKFKINSLEFHQETIRINVTNTKFRSTAQALGRVTSTLQRFTADFTKFAEISFQTGELQVASYLVDLNKVTFEQFGTEVLKTNGFDGGPIVPVDLKLSKHRNLERRFSWGVGPYLEHRFFNPELPLSMELGLQVEGAYHFTPGLKLSTALRKSALTNLTKNNRKSNSVLPHVHSDWPLYDLSGQPGHIHELALSYTKNLVPGLYGRLHSGLLEPFFAGIGGEILYKPARSSLAFGFDIHHVRQRDYEMRFDLRKYETTVGHFSIYYDGGGMFDIEVNAGKYLAGDWGATTTISRKFGSGWEVGGYATFTNTPFETFGEGSFDKAIYFTVPLDWIISSPNKTKRRLTLRPITRDGGANLGSARRLYRNIENEQASQLKREFGRLWK
ncbi:YjbH domain-containing protein [bacterium]|nr:YjbH domain-containing protein [bacterium]